MAVLKETLKGALISCIVVAAICWVVFGYLCDIPVFVWQPDPFPERYSLGQVVAIAAAAGLVVGGFIGYCGLHLITTQLVGDDGFASSVDRPQAPRPVERPRRGGPGVLSGRQDNVTGQIPSFPDIHDFSSIALRVGRTSSRA